MTAAEGVLTPVEIVALARHDLSAYATLVSPGFEVPPHVERLVSALERVERGEVRRLAVTMPPRHGKSELASVLFPAWLLGRGPERSVICASHSQELSDHFGRRVRNLLLDKRHRAIFPASGLAEDSAAASRFDLTSGGSYFGIGRGGGLTGRGGNVVVIDDPLRGPDEAASSGVRAALKDWYSGVVYTRLSPGGAVVLVSTRWSEDDLLGWLLRDHPEEGWKVLAMPAIAEADDSFRREGEALWPARFPLERLHEIRSQLGSNLWASLYQGRPVPEGGGIFRAEWFGTYRDVPPGLRVIQAWDSAFKSRAGNDWSACVTLGEHSNGGGFYVLNVFRVKAEFPDLIRRMREQAAIWNPSAVLIEDAASGQSVVQVLKSETNLPIIGVRPQGSKILRAQVAAPAIEAGRVRLPESAGWRSAFLEELVGFPNGPHDDQIDALALALSHFRESPGPFLFARGAPINRGIWESI